MQEAAYGSILAENRRAIHRRVAQAMGRAQAEGNTFWVIPSEVTSALRTLSGAFGGEGSGPRVSGWGGGARLRRAGRQRNIAATATKIKTALNNAAKLARLSPISADNLPIE